MHILRCFVVCAPQHDGRRRAAGVSSRRGRRRATGYHPRVTLDQGNLHETPYRNLLLSLGREEASAVLTLRRNQLQKEIVFDDGSPVDCRSNIATETLGRVLVASGKISEEDCQAALSTAAARGVHLGDIITERKLLPPTELYRMLQKSLARKLLEPFSWRSGTYEISHDIRPAESSLRVNVAQLLFTGMVKIEPQETADEAVAEIGGRYLTIASDPRFGLDEIRLTSEQQKVVDAIRRGTTLEEIRAGSALDADDIHRVVYALLLLGIVEATEQRPAPLFELDIPFLAQEPPAPPPRPVPVPVRAAAPDAATPDEVMAAYMTYRRKDAFDLLGVSDSDGPLQFVRAFLALADRFLPSKFDERSPDALREKARDVFLAAARAYAELADPARREALLERRERQRQPPPTAAPPALEPEQPEELESGALIDPEAFYRKGKELADAGKLREALSYFEMAAECDAQNGTYVAEATWCRFQLNVSPAMSAIKLLKDAIRIDPRSGLAHLYAGKVQTLLGNRAEAERMLDAAAMLMPRDLRVVEAMKALRASKVR